MTSYPKLHRIKRAALLLGVSKTTIYRLVRAGELVLVKMGTRASAITDDSLCAFIARHAHPGGSVKALTAALDDFVTGPHRDDLNPAVRDALRTLRMALVAAPRAIAGRAR